MRGYHKAVAVGEFVVPSKESVNNTQMDVYYTHIEAARRIVVDYALLGGDGAPRVTVRCFLGGEKKLNIFVAEERTAQTYQCGFQGQTPEQFALEVEVPSAARVGTGITALGISVERDDPTRFERRLGRLRYKGVAYEARVSAFDPDRTMSRPVLSYAIRRDGKLVGAIDLERGGSITAPSEDAEAREAVIFFAMSLMLMPDPDSMRTQGLLDPFSE